MLIQESFIWILSFMILIFLIFFLSYQNCNEYFKEHFGSECGDFIPPLNLDKKYKIKEDYIFVSIASYRDVECNDTLISMFKNAKQPKKIIAGVCQQNKEKLENCLIKSLPEVDKKQIKLIDMDYKEAKGPTFARYYCSTLWEGEQYFLQIDSHSTFVKDWDDMCREMIKKCKEESKKPILSCYPATMDQLNFPGTPEMCNGRLTHEKIPVFLAGWTEESLEKPKRSPKPFAGAGFMFLEADFLYDIPFDPNLPHLFQGEETLFSARLWTRGYDFYTPNFKVLAHNYDRHDSPRYWTDHADHDKCRQMTEKRVLFLLGVNENKPQDETSEAFFRNHHKYGFGTFRTLEEFWLASGIDFDKKEKDGIIDDCNCNSHDKTIRYDKFLGWNFKLDGYEKIKKFI